MNEKLFLDLSMVDQNTLSIPKIIMQTWKTDQVPTKWLSSQQSIQDYLTTNGWIYVLLTDKDNENFVKTFFPDYLSTYLSLPYNIQRADMIRYMWLYKYGGLYMDLDFEIMQPIDEWFQSVKADLYLAPSEGKGYFNTLSNSFMASKPKCNFWIQCLEEIKNKKNYPWYYSRHLYIIDSTGPLMIQRVFDKYNSPVAIIPRHFINSCDTCRSVCFDKGYIRKLEGNSWHNWDSTIINLIGCNPGWCAIVILVLFIIILLLIWFLFKNKLCASVCNRKK